MLVKRRASVPRWAFIMVRKQNNHLKVVKKGMCVPKLFCVNNNCSYLRHRNMS